VTNRDNKAAAAEFRQLFGMEFDEFTRQAPAKLLVALSRFAEPVDMTVLQFADERHPLFRQQRERLARALRAAWQRKDPATATRRRQITEVVCCYGEQSHDEAVGIGEGSGRKAQ